MIVDRKAILGLLPHVGPRPNIKQAFDELLIKLELEEQDRERKLTPGSALAVVDWWIGALFLARSHIENHAAGGTDFPLDVKQR